MAACDDLVGLLAKLSSSELATVNLRLSRLGKSYLAAPCSLSAMQFTALVCELRMAVPEMLDAYLASLAVGAFTPETALITTGPSETAYAVPATVIEYEVLGSIPCGSVRKVTTTTYAARSAAGWKATAYASKTLGANYTPQSFSVPVQTAYATASAQAKADVIAKVSALVPQIITNISANPDWDYLYQGYHETAFAFWWLYAPASSAFYSDPYPTPQFITPVALTLHYLDSTVSVTYDILTS